MSKGPQLKEGFYRIELNKTVWEVPERYQLLAPVGSGAYGQVCSALDKQTNFKVAIKKLARPFQSAIHAKRTYRELRMLKHMQHENVIGLLDVFTPTTRFEDFEDVYLVTALMGADMNNIIKTQRLSDDHVQFLVYQVLRAMKYIHSAGIIHRDLKPANIGINPDNDLKDLKPSNIAVNEDCELKILDFGLARHTDDQMTGYVATRWYRAPEIMLNWMHYNQTDDKIEYSPQVDMWAVGCVMAEMMHGEPLLPGLTLDIWSVGCIMAEMLTGHPLFPGTDHIDQLTRILALVGSPKPHVLQKINSPEVKKCLWHEFGMLSEDYIDQLTKILSLVGSPTPKLLEKINSEEARNYIKSLPKWEKKDFKTVFMGANPLAIDLLEKMLDLDADTRITAEQALAHPYLRQYADPTDEPTASHYDESYEEMDLTIPEWKRYVYDEVISFKPPDPNQLGQQMDIH